MKDCIEEITSFVAWIKYSSNTTALYARCTFRRVRNRVQPQASLWIYEKSLLIKIIVMFRNLLISSFDPSIRVKRAFHPALASRGFASHVFLVDKMIYNFARVKFSERKLKLKRLHRRPYFPCFSSAAPTIWNSLPEPIRNHVDISKFKTYMNTFLFK